MDEENKNNESFSEDLISQQPLMAALNENNDTLEQPKEEVKPVEVQQSVPTVQPVEPVQQLSAVNEVPVQNESLNQMNNVNLSSTQVVNPVSNIPSEPSVPVNNNKSSGSIVTAIVLILALVAAGFAGFKMFGKPSEKDEKESLPKLVYLEEATDYYLDKYDFQFNDVTKKELGMYASQSENKNGKITIEYNPDNKMIKRITVATPKKFDDAFEYAKPFLTDIENWDHLKKMMSMTEKYRASMRYSEGHRGLEFTMSMGNPAINVDVYDVLNYEPLKYISVLSADELGFKTGDGEFVFKVIPSVDGGRLGFINFYVSSDEEKVEMSFYSTSTDMKFYVKNIELSKETESLECVNREYGGKKILSCKEYSDTKLIIPFNKEDIDLNNNDKKMYMIIEVDSEDMIDTVLSNLSRK